MAKTQKRKGEMRLLGGLSKVVMHALWFFASLVLVTLPMLDMWTIQTIMTSLHMELFEMSWGRWALHLGLAVAVYLFSMFTWRLWHGKKTSIRVVKRARGTVMVEMLIILVPFLALTSGIAQIAMLNVGAILADIAVYQGARAAQIWHPESELQRTPRAGIEEGQKDWAWTVRERAKTASALVMAPSAPQAFEVGRFQNDGSSNDYRRTRSSILGSFVNGVPFSENGVPNEGRRYQLAQQASFDLGVKKNIVRDAAFSTAFDQGGSAWKRASRKMTAAYMCFDSAKYDIVVTGGRVGVDFEYYYPILFPWFGRLFGEYKAKGCFGGRGTLLSGYHHVLRRNFTLPKYPDMN